MRKTIENLEIGEKIFGRHPVDVDSLFTNISSEETIKICTNELFKESETVKGLSKSEFKDLLSLPTNYSDFIFNGTLYKQIDGMTMSFLLGCTLANALYAYHEKIDQNVFHMNIDHFTIGDKCYVGIEGTLVCRYIDVDKSTLMLDFAAVKSRDIFSEKAHVVFFRNFLNLTCS